MGGVRRERQVEGSRERVEGVERKTRREKEVGGGLSGVMTLNKYERGNHIKTKHAALNTDTHTQVEKRTQ